MDVGVAGGRKKDVPAMGRDNRQQVQVWATEVERPIAVMSVGTLEVRVGSGMGLCVCKTPS